MGIINITPDSFSDGGRFLLPERALNGAEQMLSDGADIIDIGAASSRPGAKQTGSETEWQRLAPVISLLREKIPLPLSVDTADEKTALRALNRGIDILNFTGKAPGKNVLQEVKKSGAYICLMHGGGSDAGEYDDYGGDVTAAVQLFFNKSLDLCNKNGIDTDKIILDPGFGFRKNTAQNIKLLDELQSLDTGGAALLCGLSRKRFIGEIYNIPNPADRDKVSSEAAKTAVAAGANIIRCHNIKTAKLAGL